MKVDPKSAHVNEPETSPPDVGDQGPRTPGQSLDESEGAATTITQFSLAELMGVILFAAIGFALMRLATPRVFAGIAGVAAIVGMALISAFKPRHVIVHLAWWVVLAMYVAAALIAVANV